MSMYSKKIFLSIVTLILPTLLLAEGPVGQELAENSPKTSQNSYTPPSTPELYDVNEPLVPAYVRIKKVKSHPYLGLGLSFGVSRHDGGNAATKPSWNIAAEGGYIKALSSWSRADFGVEVFNGEIGDADNDVRIKVGFLAKAGYGYNLAENLYGVLRAGYGLALASYSGPAGDKSSTSGYVAQLAFQMVVPTESSVDVLAGIFLSQYGFGNQGVYNTFDGRVGIRMRL